MSRLAFRFALAASCAVAFSSPPAFADDPLGAAVRDSVQASAHASASAAHAIAASGRATLGIVAVPLSVGAVVSGAASDLSGAAAADSIRAATAPIGTPLDITDETITVMPPNQALRPQPPAVTPVK